MRAGGQKPMGRPYKTYRTNKTDRRRKRVKEREITWSGEGLLDTPH